MVDILLRLGDLEILREDCKEASEILSSGQHPSGIYLIRHPARFARIIEALKIVLSTAPAERPKFRTGDVVRLKSGGEKMTVRFVVGDNAADYVAHEIGVHCFWQFAGIPQHAVYPEDCLFRVDLIDLDEDDDDVGR